MSNSDSTDKELEFAQELNRQFELSASGNPSDNTASTIQVDADADQSVSKRIAKAKPILALLADLHQQRNFNAEETRSSENTIPELSQVGRFTIEREIGRGGNGVVFLAQDDRLNRKVALKIPRIDGALSGSTRQRFEREARATAILNHPAIVAIYEFGHDAGIYFIASQYIEGTNLAQFIESYGPIDSLQSANIVARLAGAIEHAHQRGVLHRDLKPSNVLVQAQGRDTN